MPHVLTATQAMRTFSDLLNQVHYQGKSFEIKRGREIIAKITPATSKKGLAINTLNDFFAHLPTLDEKDAEDFANTINQIRSSISTDVDSWD